MTILDQNLIPFPSAFSHITNWICLIITGLGFIACVWLLTTNLFKTQSPSTNLLLSTICANSTVLGTVFITNIQNEIIGGYSWGKVGCHVSSYLIVSSCSVSIATLGLVAWERYQFVCRGKKWSHSKVVFWNWICWICCCLMPAVPFITSDYISIQLEPNAMNCNFKWYDWSLQSRIVTSLILSMVAVSFLTVIFSYWNIYVTFMDITKQNQINDACQRVVYRKCIVMTVSLVVLWSVYIAKMFYEICTGSSAGIDWTCIGSTGGLLSCALNPAILCKYDTRVRKNMLAAVAFSRKQTRVQSVPKTVDLHIPSALTPPISSSRLGVVSSRIKE